MAGMYIHGISSFRSLPLAWQGCTWFFIIIATGRRKNWLQLKYRIQTVEGMESCRNMSATRTFPVFSGGICIIGGNEERVKS